MGRWAARATGRNNGPETSRVGAQPSPHTASCCCLWRREEELAGGGVWGVVRAMGKGGSCSGGEAFGGVGGYLGVSRFGERHQLSGDTPLLGGGGGGGGERGGRGEGVGPRTPPSRRGVNLRGEGPGRRERERGPEEKPRRGGGAPRGGEGGWGIEILTARGARIGQGAPTGGRIIGSPRRSSGGDSTCGCSRRNSNAAESICNRNRGNRRSCNGDGGGDRCLPI